MKDLVLLVGAGAAVPCGLPSTSDLTDSAAEAVRQTYAKHYSEFGAREDLADEGTRFADLLLDKLQENYADAWNFEALIHAIRSLQGLVDSGPSGLQGAPPTFKPIARVVVELSSEFKDGLRPEILLWAFFEVVRRIHKDVGSAQESGMQAEARSHLSAFLNALAIRFRLIALDLNYDTLFDDAGVRWFDGYRLGVSGDPYAVFDPQGWVSQDSASNLLLHLHGSVRFGYPPAGAPSLSSPWEPVKYSNAQEANKSLKLTGSASTLIGDVDHGAFALISGLDKAGSLAYNARPFAHYYVTAANLLFRSKRVAIIGYGGRDPHVNTWLSEHAAINGDYRRGIIVLPYKPEWQGLRRGENTYLRSIVGSERWDRGNGIACGTWRDNVLSAGPSRLYSIPAPTAYSRVHEMIEFLDEI